MTVAPVTLAVLIAATLIIALLPFVLFRMLRKPLALDRRDTIVGVAVFTLFAMIVERAFHGLVLSRTPDGGWLTQPLAFVAYGALSSAVFEEVGRYVGMRFLSRRYGASAGDGRGIGYGLGHAGAEAWFVGVLVWGQWSYLAWLASRGQLETQLADLPGDTVVRLHVMLATLSAQSILLLLLGAARRSSCSWRCRCWCGAACAPAARPCCRSRSCCMRWRSRRRCCTRCGRCRPAGSRPCISCWPRCWSPC
jgi:uncharacterized membrane protein YhfC